LRGFLFWKGKGEEGREEREETRDGERKGMKKFSRLGDCILPDYVSCRQSAASAPASVFPAERLARFPILEG
jgi:hypothetical protein